MSDDRKDDHGSQDLAQNSPQEEPDAVRAVLDQLEENLKAALTSMPTGPDGRVSMTYAELTCTILASAFGLAITMGATNEQLERVINTCMHRPEPKKIILS